MSSGQNLLFGLLALQNGFVSADQLVAAFGGWTADKRQTLDQILLAQAAISVAKRDLLAALVAEHLAQHGHDPQKSLAALSSISDARVALASIDDSDVQADLLSLSMFTPRVQDEFASTVLPQTSLPRVASQSADGRRFRVMRSHARGGLGEVFVAVDTELNREVALKEIQTQFADNPSNRNRFVREAEITGGLEHPSIVPVYGLGSYADGRPFYAMKFIRGDSLKEAIAVHHQPGGTASDKSIALRQLLQRFIDICEAMQYAHDRGILHRDLKPGNIMLGRYGETLVVDWGLAKPLGKNEEASTENMLIPASSGSGETIPGSAIGTPAYMSPEQASGHVHNLGPATDVYSLGATLYHILTGSAPFAGRAKDVLIQVIEGQFSKPRDKSPQVPKALEAICLKAMALKPADRYSSAKLLAEDVERWLADEPVSVVAETVTGRLTRFGRKHRGAVVAVLAASLLLAVGSTIAAIVIDQQRQSNASLADEKSKLADEKTKLAAEKSTLADENAKLAEVATRRADQAAAANNAAQYQLYIAQIERASSRLDAHDHTGAASLLADIPLDRRGWEYNHLWRKCEGTTETLRGHTSGVSSVSFNPDGARLASASYDNTIKIWDTATGAEIQTLRGHTGWVYSVSFSPDGVRLASASNDQTIKIWDAATGAELQTLRGHTGVVTSVSFSPDGARLASASYDQSTKIWDAATGAELQTLHGHTGWVTSVSFSPDGARLASGSNDQTIKIWDTATRAELQTLRGHTGGVSSVSFSPDGARLASVSNDQTIKIWDSATGAELQTLRGHTFAVSSVSYSPDGARLASAAGDQTIKIWDSATGAEPQTLRGHTGVVRSVIFSPDGARLASASWDNTIKIWDTATGAELQTLRGHTGGVTSVIFSPDGARLASASSDQTIKIWDAATGAELQTLRGHTGVVTSVSFSPDGARLASSGSLERTIKIWDAATGAELQTLQGHTSGVNSVSFSPDGARLASASNDQMIKIWDNATGAQLQTLRGHTSGVNSVSFSTAGTRLISSGSFDLTIKIWDAATGAELQTLRGHTGAVTSVSLSPDGARLASASYDLTIKIWDAATGAELQTLRGHTSFVSSVSFSPDGARLASAAGDTTIKLWDSATGAELQALRGHTAPVTSVSFSPDGARLISRDSSGKTLFWKMPEGIVLDEAVPHETITHDKSSNGLLRAIPNGFDVLIIHKNPQYDPWAEGTKRRRLLAPKWHSDEAASAEQSANWFAAVFHLSRLIELKPDDGTIAERLVIARKRLASQKP